MRHRHKRAEYIRAVLDDAYPLVGSKLELLHLGARIVAAGLPAALRRHEVAVSVGNICHALSAAAHQLHHRVKLRVERLVAVHGVYNVKVRARQLY